MSDSILGKAEVGSSILPGGTTSPLENKGFEARPHPSPHAEIIEHPANPQPEGGENAGTGSRRVPQRRKAEWRFVYFVQAHHHGLIKIGVANDVMARLAALRSASPVKLRLKGVIPSDRAEALEGSIHAQFGHFRSHGEWFHPITPLLDFIRARAINLDAYEHAQMWAAVLKLRA
jgi:hypothetical protein